MADYFDKDNYVGVHERIAKFREEHKEGMITTFREKGTDGSEYFKAVVFRNREEAKLFPSLAAASGHADVVEGGKKASEKAETVAIGRALAILGYDVKKGIASAEEMEQAQERGGSSEEKPSRFGRSSDKEEAKEEKKNSRFNRPAKEEAKEEKAAAPAEESEEEAPKSSRFAPRSSEKQEAKETKPANEEAAEEESSDEDSSDAKSKLRSSRPFKSGSRFTRGAGA